MPVPFRQPRALPGRPLSLRLTLWCLALALLLVGPAGSWAKAKDDATKPIKLIPNARCLKCHNDEDEKTSEREDGTVINIFVDAERFEHSVHGHQPCQGCHNSVTKAQHDTPLPKSIGCVECHMKTWEAQQESGETRYKRLDVVLEQINGYMNSVHARPNLMDQSRTNATCYDCHNAHDIGTIGSAARAESRRRNPEVCGRCHADQKEQYEDSIHGRAHADLKAPDRGLTRPRPEAAAAHGGVIAAAHEGSATDAEPAAAADKTQPGPAVCSDCHTPHNIDEPFKDPTKLLITENCGACHQQQLKTYEASYHGQVIRAGYTHTAKCYDCHGSHGIMAVDDPASKVHPNNRLATCRQCHEDAPPGFLGFHAHGDASDFKNYPEMFLTKRFMDVLIIGVFLFFWTHMLLWMHREWRERKAGKGYKADPQNPEQIWFRRFSLGWRLAHGILAIAVMTLVLTGTAVLYSGQAWAQWVFNVIGGPQVAAIVHRVAAVTFIAIFFGHLVVVAVNVWRGRGRFRWFGPNSMVPNWQDITDIGLMFKWFFGRAERPHFDRWSYWEKFDYWAPFWGMMVIGFSGLMLWFPTITASVLPGWVFNIATIVHAEEAVLAAVFLFTVHYFNVHFRPEKFPMDTVMVTGAVPLAEFKHEHRHEYERLKASGELEKYLVKPPSEAARRTGRKITGWLIVIGLILAVLVIKGQLAALGSH